METGESQSAVSWDAVIAGAVASQDTAPGLWANQRPPGRPFLQAR